MISFGGVWFKFSMLVNIGGLFYELDHILLAAYLQIHQAYYFSLWAYYSLPLLRQHLFTLQLTTFGILFQ